MRKLFYVVIGVFALSAGAYGWMWQQRAQAAVNDPATVSAEAFLALADEGRIRGGAVEFVPGSDRVMLTGWSTAAAGAAEAAWTAVGRLDDAQIERLQAAGLETRFRRTAGGPVVKIGAAEQVALTVLAVSGAFLVAFIVMAVHRRYRGAAGEQVETAPNVTFNDVAGCEEAKEEVREIVDFLRDPAAFTRTGAKLPRGLLLVGPPGAGKTLLARAVAGEAGVPFFSVSGSDFVEIYVGTGARRVRSLFAQARRQSPCIIFIDELDAVGGARSANKGGGADREHDQTLNALLVAMDGFAKNDRVVVFAATNRVDTLDEALRRPGRFDREVRVELPDVVGREAILRVHARDYALHETVKLEEVAMQTSGFSGADLGNLLNEAALYAARGKRGAIEPVDLDAAREKVCFGRERSYRMTPEDRRTIAFHEAGHALVQVLSGEDAMQLHKVTIIPRGPSLGSTLFVPTRDILNSSEEQIRHRIRCLMAGRLAEEICLGRITSGASGDIKEATRLARKMVFQLGMSPLGFVAVSTDDGAAQSDDASFISSAAIRHEADSHVVRLLSALLVETREIVQANRAGLEGIASALLERETISGADVRTILRLGPGAPTAVAAGHPLAAFEAEQ